MIKYPIILVVSEGNVEPVEIINNIRKIPQEDQKEVIASYPNQNLTITGYVFNLKTKYYQTNLYLVPFEEDISLTPLSIQEKIECVLIYFDSGQKSFSNRIPKYAKFLEENDVEMGILLCDKLFNDPSEGITYKQAKQESKLLDVIELAREKNNEEDNDFHNPVGYDELMQALRNFLWSNVDKLGIAGSVHSRQSNDESQATRSSNSTEEEELEAFENLLVEVMNFKNISSTWSRNERLNYMERFSEKFDRLLCEDTSSEEDNE